MFKNKLTKTSKSQIFSDFIHWNFKNNLNLHTFNFNFLLQELHIGGSFVKFNNQQLLALCFQYLIHIPFQPEKNTYLTSLLIKKFLKCLGKNKIQKKIISNKFIDLPDIAFTPLMFNKAINILKEINNPQPNNKLSSDAKIVWDINHFYFALEFSEFLVFIDHEYLSIDDQLTEEEYLHSKCNYFSQLLKQKQIFKTTIFSNIFEQSTRKNLINFLELTSYKEKIHYNS